MPEANPSSGREPTRLVLKVDVDTKVGLLKGVPRLLELLRKLELKASFFVAMGPDHSGRALKRLFKPGFLAKQMRSGAGGAYGPVTMLYGLVLPGPIIAQAAPGMLNRIINDGHEAGLHAWDHVFWHDKLTGLSPAVVRQQLGQAWGLFKQITGMAPKTFASPGWQVTEEAFKAMCELGITHASCTRGERPFRPLADGRALPILELPTTLPSLDELLGRDGVTPQNAGLRLADLVRPGKLNIFTLHAEVEGRALAPALMDFCRALMDQGVEFVRLVDAARLALAENPPAEALAWCQEPGRAGELSCPASYAARSTS